MKNGETGYLLVSKLAVEILTTADGDSSYDTFYQFADSFETDHLKVGLLRPTSFVSLRPLEAIE